MRFLRGAVSVKVVDSRGLMGLGRAHRETGITLNFLVRGI